MHKQLKQAIDLSRKTGDRLIVYDMSQDDSAFVVMNLDEYEKLALGKHEIHDLTEDELLDKINRDIATWKSEQIDDKINSKNAVIDVSGEDGRRFNSIEDFTGRVDDNDLMLEEKTYFSKTLRDRQKKNSQWKIPSERKENAEEVIEEDRQYLEEVQF